MLSSNLFSKTREDPLSIDRAKLTGAISSQAILRFLEPHRIKRGIRLVETGDQTFHQRRAVIGRELKGLMQNGFC